MNGYSEGNSSHQSNVNKYLFFDKSISAYDRQSNTLTDPIEDAMDSELLAYKIFEQLGPKYEEMRRTLDYIPEPSRKIMLGNALFSAISSDNPVDTMNKKLTDLRKSSSSVMMVNDLASFYGTNKAYIKEWLKLKFKQKK